MIFKEEKLIALESLKALYEDVGWYAYTQDITRLQQACLQSLDVFSAWEEDRLIGLVRTIGDGLTIVYVQDILVLNAYQNRGIASMLMTQVLEKYRDVRQKVLLTEEAPDVRHFYEKHGFRSCDNGDLVAFAKLDQ